VRRLQYHRYGGPNEVRLEEFKPTRPGPAQILVRVKAASVNPVDWKIRSGTLKFITGKRFPRAMGSDFSGIVEAVGTSVTRLKIGDEVLGMTSMKDSGAFAETVLIDEKLAVVKPPALSFEHAATLPVVGQTAWHGLVDKAHLRPGQSVFVHGCLGGVGRAVVHLARMLGAQVAGSCRGSAMEEARALGIYPVVDYQQLKIGSLTNQFDVVFDTAGTLSLKDGRALLKRGGVVLDIVLSSRKVVGILFSPQHKFVVGKHSPDVLAKIADAAAVGKLPPLIGRTVPLSQAISALAELEQRGTPKGKLVIVPA
jgi:NADPH:quinone reductase-like Zn-dependent oxidoreductase